jgi:hypothetical protein
MAALLLESAKGYCLARGDEPELSRFKSEVDVVPGDIEEDALTPSLVENKEIIESDADDDLK